ncbi:potassium/proton antiporter [Haploplasma modicum]|uniref:potassium/proton antiporter n=1 Tax=Haploplasma modicum TaxID=2150 RepID=UPI000691A76C|nr:potassium/proton antiporter [Haploplasma modicum]
MGLEILILIGGIVLLFSVFLSKAMYRFGIPTLILFLVMGMLAGNSKFGIIEFNDFKLAESIASFALLVIIFSGGFDTNWKKAKTNSNVSIALASVGVFITAFAVGLFTKIIIKDFTWLEALLIGAIISSTDAAAVFSILRSKKLNLKNNIGPLLEMESGSNDPSAYMITIILIGAITNNGTSIFLTFFLQVVNGIAIGALVGLLGVKIINKIKLEVDGLYIILSLGLMLLSFGLASYLGGNGFLAVYLTGIIMGNTNIVYKASLTQFFDGFSWLAQILLFFTLGLFVIPSLLVEALIPGILIALFISFVARPLAVIPIMKIFKKPFKDSILVSWVGFRGAASIVFAIFVFSNNLDKGTYIFDIVFVVAIVSVLMQGLLLVPVAKKLDLIEEEDSSSLKVFTDYSGAIFTDLLEVHIEHGNEIIGKRIKELEIPDTILIVLIKRDYEMIPPRGSREILEDDVLLLAGATKQDLLDADKKIKGYKRQIEEKNNTLK